MSFCCRISLAEAHCKLCLRTQVLEEDAVIAVLLCENSVTLKHGTLSYHFLILTLTSRYKYSM